MRGNASQQFTLTMVVAILGVLVGTTGVGLAASGYYSETFNSGYSVGVLQGQNGWVSVYDDTPGPNLHGSSGIFRDAGQVINLGGGNYAVTGGPNSNDPLQLGNYGSKVVSGGFGLTNSARDAYYQFDARRFSGPGNLQFAIGPDEDGDGALENTFGGGGNENGPMVAMNEGAIFLKASRGLNETPFDYGVNDDIGDWLQFRLVMDFTALSGNGTGRLFYRNITDDPSPAAPFTELTSSAFNLRIADMFNPPQSPNYWDGIFIRLDTSAPALDNIVVLVPEPGSMLLLTMSALMLRFRRRS